MLGSVLRCGVGGITLGVTTLATFSFVGVPTIPTGPPRAVTLQAALLGGDDLPPGFAPAPGPPAPPGAGCPELLAHPTAGWAGAVERNQRQARTGLHLWQAVATPAGDALSRLRARLSHCPGVRELPRPIPAGWAFAVSVGSDHGYLAAGQVGSAVSVLRFLGPAGPATEAATRPEAVAVTLRTALAKLVSVTGPPQR